MLSDEIQCCSSIFVRKPRYGRHTEGPKNVEENARMSTILQMHSHRGYADADMNDNRLYWDATLTKSWHQGRWVAKLKGYDLLGQVSQWQYYVNAQGRTEYWTNNMRRYVFLSLSYRFSVTPKKK